MAKKDSDIYGRDETALADKLARDAESQLQDAGKYVDVWGVKDSRAKHDLEDK